MWNPSIGTLLRLVARWALLLLGVGCGAIDRDGAASLPVIGGFDGSDPAWDAIGTVGTLDEDGRYKASCTASLVSRRAVLTAKHCALFPESAPPLIFLDYEPIYFAIGPDAAHPKRVIQLVSVSLPPAPDQPGWGELPQDWASDIALFTLAEPVDDPKPLLLAPAALTEAAVGEKLTVVGYGFQDLAQTASGTRKLGQVSLVATSGSPLAALYPNEDDYVSMVTKVLGPLDAAGNSDRHHYMYQSRLAKDYQLWAGGRPNDAQACSGDSGGPLLRRVGNRLHVVGTTSAGLFPWRCVGGVLFSNVGPSVQSMVSQVANDPCGSLTAQGQCSGSVALRCTTPSEGERRAVRLDCAELGKSCVADTRGQATCGDPPPPPPPQAPCSTLKGPQVTVQRIPGGPPNMPTGGTIPDGTYVATAITYYAGPGTTSGTEGTGGNAVRIKGNQIQTTYGVGTFEIVGRSLHIKHSCPRQSERFWPYSVSGDQLTLFDFSGPVAFVTTTQRQ